MLPLTYYAQKYASIIGACLPAVEPSLACWYNCKHHKILPFCQPKWLPSKFQNFFPSTTLKTMPIRKYSYTFLYLINSHFQWSIARRAGATTLKYVT